MRMRTVTVAHARRRCSAKAVPRSTTFQPRNRQGACNHTLAKQLEIKLVIQASLQSHRRGRCAQFDMFDVLPIHSLVVVFFLLVEASPISSCQDTICTISRCNFFTSPVPPNPISCWNYCIFRSVSAGQLCFILG